MAAREKAPRTRDLFSGLRGGPFFALLPGSYRRRCYLGLCSALVGAGSETEQAPEGSAERPFGLEAYGGCDSGHGGRRCVRALGHGGSGLGKRPHTSAVSAEHPSCSGRLRGPRDPGRRARRCERCVPQFQFGAGYSDAPACCGRSSRARGSTPHREDLGPRGRRSRERQRRALAP